MIRQTASLTASLTASSSPLRRIKVAIVGSGMTGVTVASTLLDEIIIQSNTQKLKLDVTIYEAGRGIGGRMSTRYTTTTTNDDDDSNINGKMKQEQQQLQFDHGCQYIGPAKTEEFKLVLQDWDQRGWIKEWKGRFGRIVYNSNNNKISDYNKQLCSADTIETTIAYEETTNNTKRYVGFPRMNSICENIISHSLTGSTVTTAAAAAATEHLPSHDEENIPSTLTVRTDTRIQHATSLLEDTIISDYSSTTNDNCYKSSRMWQLAQRKKKHITTTTTTTATANGNISDKDNSVVIDGDDDCYYDWLVVTDLSSARSLIKHNDINTSTSTVEYNPVCTTMITLNHPLSIPVDGIELSPNMEDNFGSLGWIARDSSKPGRRRHTNNDNEYDKRESWILQSTSLGGKAILDTMQGQSINQIREEIRKTMVNDFINSIPHLMSVIGGGDNNDVVIDISNMPTVIDSVGHRWGAAFPINANVDMDCYLDMTQQLVLCGDYFGTRNGRVEGAFLSGRSAAQNLIRQIMKNET